MRIIFRERKVPRLFCLFVCLERKVALLFRSCLFEKEKNKEEEIGVGFCVLFLSCFFFSVVVIAPPGWLPFGRV